MKEYDKIFPINEVHQIRKKPVPIKNVVEMFRFGARARTFIHFLENGKDGHVQNVYVVNYQPANNISTEIISEQDFKMARVQMVAKSIEPEEEDPLFKILKRVKDSDPELYNKLYGDKH